MARSPEPADDAEVLRRFQEQLAQLDNATAVSFAQRLMRGGSFGGGDAFVAPPPPPSARRPRRNDVVTLRVRVDLQGTRPPLWRRLEIASDMLLSELHDVLQVAFGWTDSHLHRFSSGTSIYDRSAEAYLMPFEIEEGEIGVAEGEVRIDELLVDVGDRITYGYDFGDDWMHTVKLEAVSPRAASAPRAVCTGGRRPGPPEDCGGVDGYELWCAVTDPGHPEHAAAVAEVRARYGDDLELDAYAPTPFDADEITAILAGPASSGQELPAALAELLAGVRSARDAAWLEAAISTIPLPDAPAPDAAAEAVRPFLWLLDRVGTDGITLTGAGYLPPAQVEAFADALGISDEWIGKLNRETHTLPVLEFREAAQKALLVRKHRGKLVLAPAGRKLRNDPVGLWWHLAAQLPVRSADECARHAGLLLLIGVAAGWADLDAGIARGLDAIGWVGDSGRLTTHMAYSVSRQTRTVLHRMGALDRRRLGEAEVATEIGVAFARAAVWTWP
ncbi:plasmid pRiA4b ORF-3 family protein [Pseudonocardia sp. CA-107938]|uniref:plasmid pRiA4b ORF-3 family protein n=1 Tax=Pseudonocardia sp. CA-107938 TaxID=3240021 RepID=UPI003D8CB0E2